MSFQIGKIAKHYIFDFPTKNETKQIHVRFDRLVTGDLFQDLDDIVHLPEILFNVIFNNKASM